MFKLIWKIKLLDGEMGREVGRAAVHGVVKTQTRLGDWTTTTNLDKYLNIKRESLHGEKYSPVLEWAKKIFGPSPETPPSGGMIKKAGAPRPWHFLWPLAKVLCLQGSPWHTTHAPAQMSFFFSFFKKLLKCSWLAMLCQFQVHSKVIQLYSHHFYILFYYRLLQDTEYSSLCYIVGACCLSALCMVMCIC